MSAERNMYGCLPCPHCGSVYRYGRRDAIHCDDCGHREIGEPVWDDTCVLPPTFDTTEEET